MFKVNDKVVRRGTFDGNVGTIAQLNYITESLVLVRFGGGMCFEDVGDLVLYSGQE